MTNRLDRAIIAGLNANRLSVKDCNDTMMNWERRKAQALIADFLRLDDEAHPLDGISQMASSVSATYYADGRQHERNRLLARAGLPEETET